MTQQPPVVPVLCPACGSGDIHLVNPGPDLDEGRQPVFGCGTLGCSNYDAPRYTLTEAARIIRARAAQDECAARGHRAEHYTTGGTAWCACGKFAWVMSEAFKAGLRGPDAAS